MTDNVWFITGAGRGMGLDITKAALAADYKVVATGRDADKVARAVGESANLLVVKMDVTNPADAESAVKAVMETVWSYRCTGQQCSKLLCRVFRGDHVGRDG
jgi:NAD(P)-dependent dehydrogenase (short-subunit alcohol dehydrogenase family)